MNKRRTDLLEKKENRPGIIFEIHTCASSLGCYTISIISYVRGVSSTTPLDHTSAQLRRWPYIRSTKPLDHTSVRLRRWTIRPFDYAVGLYVRSTTPRKVSLILPENYGRLHSMSLHHLDTTRSFRLSMPMISGAKLYVRSTISSNASLILPKNDGPSKAYL
jgi:hypothetical protein